MKTIAHIALALAAALALSACDPYTDENTGPGTIVSVFSSSAQTDSATGAHLIDTVDGTKDATSGAWTISGATYNVDALALPAAAARAEPFWPVVWVRFNAGKLLDGNSIQAPGSQNVTDPTARQSCVPATALLLTVTESTAYTAPCLADTVASPAVPRWFACYVPNTATGDEGAGVVFYKGCDDITSTGTGWNWNANLEAGARYHITANVKDPQGRSYPIDVTLETLPELPQAAISATAATSTTLDWSPFGFAAFSGTSNHKVERFDNVPAGTPPVDAPGRTPTVLATPTPATLTFTDATAATGTKYWYRVSAVSTINGLENPSDMLPNFPASPAVAFNAVDATGVTVEWPADANGMATTFAVQQAPNVPAGTPPVDAPGTYTTIGNVAPSGDDTEIFVVTGLTAQTTYWFRVVATNANNSTVTTGAGASVRTPAASP